VLCWTRPAIFAAALCARILVRSFGPRAAAFKRLVIGTAVFALVGALMASTYTADLDRFLVFAEDGTFVGRSAAPTLGIRCRRTGISFVYERADALGEKILSVDHRIVAAGLDGRSPCTRNCFEQLLRVPGRY
jgi:hypothetical protein